LPDRAHPANIKPIKVADITIASASGNKLAARSGKAALSMQSTAILAAGQVETLSDMMKRVLTNASSPSPMRPDRPDQCMQQTGMAARRSPHQPLPGN